MGKQKHCLLLFYQAIKCFSSYMESQGLNLVRYRSDHDDNNCLFIAYVTHSPVLRNRYNDKVNKRRLCDGWPCVCLCLFPSVYKCSYQQAYGRACVREACIIVYLCMCLSVHVSACCSPCHPLLCVCVIIQRGLL